MLHRLADTNFDTAYVALCNENSRHVLQQMCVVAYYIVLQHSSLCRLSLCCTSTYTVTAVALTSVHACDTSEICSGQWPVLQDMHMHL